ncbi:MAG: PIG-L family deacetylase [Bryobacterales bacterium]|nr:PIG-L family deacetylase [Bryobacterales bacterium]
MDLPESKGILIVVAHPDDETLGCAHELLRRAEACHILHTTDGAPFESRFWEQAGASSREEYATRRREELVAAMSVFGVDVSRLKALPVPDRDAVKNLPLLIDEIEYRLERLAPAVVYTHPFEGGHPDHDATAFAVRQGVERLRRSGRSVPEVREFSGYHARNGEFYQGKFLGEHGGAVEDDLSPAEQARKSAALDCYRSQQRVTSRFPLSPQRWRIAPLYNFTRRPHEGPLYYEIRNTGYTFEDFAALVRESAV